MEVTTPFYLTPFVDVLEKMPGNSVVFSSGNKLVFAGDIYQKSIELANGLRQKGFKEKDRLAIIVPPGKDFLEIFFAANMLKGLLSIIDPEMGRDNFESKLKQLQPKWIFIDSRLLLLQENAMLRLLYIRFSKHPFYFSFKGDASIIATGKKLPLFKKNTRLQKLYSSPIQPVAFKEDFDQDFMITYTSGTLAEPKGVVHSINSLYKSLLKIKEIVGSQKNSRIAAYLPHFLLFGICSGNPVFLFDKNKPEKWIINFFSENSITTLFGPPSFYMPLIEYCKKLNIMLPNSLHLLILGSAPVHPKFVKMLYEVVPTHTKIICLYGMTENLIICSIDGKDKINSTEAGDIVGKPFEGNSISIAADGEILVESPQLFSRYLHLQQRETPHKTGDLGYLTPDGLLVLNGRKKDMIIRRDTNIYPAIYEKTIKNIPGVAEAVLVGIYSEQKHDEEVFLVVESEKYSEPELRKLLINGKYSIDKEAMPDKILFMKIPLSGRQNKVDRKMIREKITK
ncbi:class I adenylate-forming enzyme family protein [soil metagenome]